MMIFVNTAIEMLKPDSVMWRALQMTMLFLFLLICDIQVQNQLPRHITKAFPITQSFEDIYRDIVELLLFDGIRAQKLN